MAQSKEHHTSHIDLSTLKFLHSSPPPSGKLNVPFRNELKSFAASYNCNFAQDNIGNIYITRPGTDSSLSAIAVNFPLDHASESSSSSSQQHIYNSNSFNGALHTFVSFLNTESKCDICLLGWSSPGNSTIGRDVWEQEIDAEEAYGLYPELKFFQNLHDVAEFGCSALLIIEEVDGAEKLEIRGSPLLKEQARAYLPKDHSDGFFGGGEEGIGSDRCPVLWIRGEGAVGVGKGVVVGYSEYVAKLFENFD